MVLVNHELKALYIHIPKVAGCFIEHILMKLYGFVDFEFPQFDRTGMINLLGDCGKEGFYKNILRDSNDIKQYDIQNYFKFTFVRCPYTRFISAYKYLNRYYDDTEDTGIPFPTFDEYLDRCEERRFSPFYWIHVLTTQIDHIEDFQGNINFDFIGRFERLNEDFCYIITQIFKQPIFFKKVLQVNFRRNSNPRQESYIPYFTDRALDFVNRYYDKEFSFFNYRKAYKLEDLESVIPKEGRPDNTNLIELLEQRNLFGQDRSRELKILLKKNQILQKNE